MNILDIAEQGEESGREEASDDFPYIPEEPDYRMLYRFGRGRAQGLYQLRGKLARIFAQNWSIGYTATCGMLKLVCAEELRQVRIEESEEQDATD